MSTIPYRSTTSGVESFIFDLQAQQHAKLAAITMARTSDADERVSVLACFRVFRQQW
jgi:hypothetical protein